MGDAHDQYVLWCRHSDVLGRPRPSALHAIYGASKALIDIRTLEVIRGSLPSRALALTLEWAALHRKELEDWDLCVTKQTPKKIPPLA